MIIIKCKVLGSGGIFSKCNSASYLIDGNILLDVPNGTCKTLMKKNIDPKNINYVLITHFHGDHYFDMPFLLLKKIKSKEKGLMIYCDKPGRNRIEDITKLAFSSTSKDIRKSDSIIYNYKESFSVKDYNIEKILVKHGSIKPSYGYIFSHANKKIGFTGDSCMCESIENMASICNAIICDCSFKVGNDKHMGIDNIVYLSYKYPLCKFYTTHMDDNIRDEISKLNDKNIILLEDDMELNF